MCVDCCWLEFIIDRRLDLPEKVYRITEGYISVSVGSQLGAVLIINCKYWKSTGYGPDCKTFSSESSPLKSDWFQPSIISAKECGKCKREWEVWRHVTMVANFLISGQSFLSEIAICIVERWKKSMTYSFVPESNHHTSRHVKVFVFFSTIYRTTFCRDPKIFLPWQRDETTSSLY